MKMFFWRQRDRKLGVAQRAGGYDLPLHRSAGSGFLMLLVALMSFLAVMTLAGRFALNGVTARWSSGLENRATIEIPARKNDGNLRSDKEIEALSGKVAALLQKDVSIAAFEVMERAQVAALVEPWLGTHIPAEEMPLPGLVSVTFKASSPEQVSTLSASLSKIAQDIRLDTHESWLEDILRMAGSLKLAAGFVTLVIGLTTVMAIAGAVRSRMAEFRADIELLHLMGAGPDYISRQFQRYNVQIALQGSLMGVAAGICVLLLFLFLLQHGDNPVMPSVFFGFSEFLSLLSLPAAACLIAFLTARFTVLRTLSLLP